MSLTIEQASETLTSSLLETSLTHWINNQSIEGQKPVAAEFIRNAYQSQQTSLDLSALGLTKLPSCLGLLVHLEKLDVHSNKLKKMPSSIGELTRLRELRTYDNLLEQLPSSIKKLSLLTLLNVTSNNISKLPKEIGALTHLKTLNLRSNKLKKLPSHICNLVELQALVVASNKLEKLPKHFSRLQNIKTLDIGDNKFHEIPRQICQITELEELYLYHNKLKKLSSKIKRLANLKIIDLEKCKLQEWPNVLSELSSLKAIILKNNDIRQISFGIYWLKHLERLSLEGNKELSKLPLSVTLLPELRKLDVSGTKISEITRDQALEACKIKRDNDPEVFQARLILWEEAADMTLNSGKITWLTPSERSILDEWLRRLEETKDFLYHQRDLAEAVCNILADVLEDEEFKKIFLDRASENNVLPENRAAMALNEIYAIWKVWFMPGAYSLKEKVGVMLQAAKTLALRHAVELDIKEFVDVHELGKKESIDVHVYYETLLKDELELLTIIKMVNRNNHCSWIDIEQLKQRVNKNYLDILLVMPVFQKFALDTDDFQTIWRPIEETYTAALKGLQATEVDSDKFSIRAAEIHEDMKATRNDALLAWVKAVAGLK